MSYRFKRPEERTLTRLLAYQAAQHPDRVFFRYANERAYTFAEMDSWSNRIAGGLKSLGIEKGDRVGLLLPNCAEFVPAWFGISKLGAVEVPINHDLKGQLLSYVLQNSGCKALVCHARFLADLAAVLPENPFIETVVVVATTAADAQAAGIRVSCLLTYGELADQRDLPVEDRVQHTDNIAILYTSGTTGPSKGVMSSHHQFYVWAEAIAANMGLTPEDTYYHCLPLFYGDAQFMATYFALVFGSTVTIYERFSASRYWSQIRDCKATTTNLLGAMAHILWKQPPSPDDRDNTIRVCNSIPMVPFKQDFEERFSLGLVTGYGQTETSLVTYDTVEESRAGACGRPGPAHEVAVVDEYDWPVPPRTVGEIVVRPREPWSIFSGYYNMPDKTAAAWRNLWFHTGDAGYLDEDGWLYFVERLKDSIRRRGQNISAYEVESVINEHPAVLECAAVAVPSELSEDEVKVVVVLRDAATLTPVELIRFCEERMAPFMIPRYVEFKRELLPRTPSEKVAKEDLRKEGVTSVTWDREAALGAKQHRSAGR